MLNQGLLNFTTKEALISLLSAWCSGLRRLLLFALIRDNWRAKISLLSEYNKQIVHKQQIIQGHGRGKAGEPA